MIDNQSFNKITLASSSWFHTATLQFSRNVLQFFPECTAVRPGMRYNFPECAAVSPERTPGCLSGNPAAEVGASVLAYEDTFGNGLADFDKQAAVRPYDDAFDLFLCDDELFVGAVEAFRIEQSGHFVQRTPVAEPCPVRNADVTVLVGHVYVGHIGSVYRDEPVPCGLPTVSGGIFRQ